MNKLIYIAIVSLTIVLVAIAYGFYPKNTNTNTPLKLPEKIAKIPLVIEGEKIDNPEYLVGQEAEDPIEGKIVSTGVIKEKFGTCFNEETKTDDTLYMVFDDQNNRLRFLIVTKAENESTETGSEMQGTVVEPYPYPKDTAKEAFYFYKVSNSVFKFEGDKLICTWQDYDKQVWAASKVFELFKATDNNDYYEQLGRKTISLPFKELPSELLKEILDSGELSYKIIHKNNEWEISQLSFHSSIDVKTNQWQSWGLLIAKDNKGKYYSFLNIPKSKTVDFDLYEPDVFNCPDFFTQGKNVDDLVCLTACGDCSIGSPEYNYYIDLKNKTIADLSDVPVVNYLIEEKEFNIPEAYDERCEEGVASSYISVNRKYPQLSELKDHRVQHRVNQQLRQHAGLVEGEWEMPATIKVDYKIVYQDNFLISVKFSHDHFVCGARHPTHWYQTLNVDLQTGNYFKLNDVLIDNSSDKLISLVRQALAKDDIYSDMELKNAGAFTFDRNHLYLHYSDYEIGSYAMGSPEIKIELYKIRHLIDPKGPLAFLIKVDNDTSENDYPFYSVSPEVMPPVKNETKAEKGL